MRPVVNLRLRLPVRTVEEFVARYGEDVSRSGMRVRTAGACQVGAAVKLDLQFQDGSSLLSGDGTISWSRPPDGVGVQFEKLSPSSQFLVDKIVQSRGEKGGNGARGPKLVGVDVDSGELLAHAGPEEATPAVAMEMPAEARREDSGPSSARRTPTGPLPTSERKPSKEGGRETTPDAPTPAFGVVAMPSSAAPVGPPPPVPAASATSRSLPAVAPQGLASVSAAPPSGVRVVAPKVMGAPSVDPVAELPSQPTKKGKGLVFAALAVVGLVGGGAALLMKGGSKPQPAAPSVATSSPSPAQRPSTPAPSAPAAAPSSAAPAPAAVVATAPSAPVVENEAPAANPRVASNDSERRERERDNDRRHPPARGAHPASREPARSSASADRKESGSRSQDNGPAASPAPSVEPAPAEVAARSARVPAPAAPAPVEARAVAAAPSVEPAPIAGSLTHRLGLTSIPSQAEVFLDGQSIGRTPLFGAAVDNTRSHVITIRKEGFQTFEEKISPSSAWTIKVSDRSTAILRISALLKKQ